MVKVDSYTITLIIICAMLAVVLVIAIAMLQGTFSETKNQR
jgi:hypothetical protein